MAYSVHPELGKQHNVSATLERLNLMTIRMLPMCHRSSHGESFFACSINQPFALKLKNKSPSLNPELIIYSLPFQIV